MSNTRSTFLIAVVFAISILCFSPSDVFAQVEKGTKEILVFSGNFSIDTKEVQGFNTNTFNIGGKLGYFLSQRNEIGVGTNLNITHFKFCPRDITNAPVINIECDSDTTYSQGVSGFYRYNFADKGDKRFPFVGTELLVSNLTTNYTGNFKLRPHVGYKYFLNKNVALDGSVGFLVDLNKKRGGSPFITTDRQAKIDGQLGLSFVF